jgi:hypothetical protein
MYDKIIVSLLCRRNEVILEDVSRDKQGMQVKLWVWSKIDCKTGRNSHIIFFEKKLIDEQYTQSKKMKLYDYDQNMFFFYFQLINVEIIYKYIYLY